MIDSGGRKIRIRVSSLLFQDAKLLLIAHKKNDQVYWLAPGGGVGYGESLPEALRREIREELGIDVDVQNIAFICDSIEPEYRRHILHVFFFCHHAGGDYVLGEEERLHDYSFFSAEEIEDIILFPPVKDEIAAIMRKEDLGNIYRKKRWVPL